MKKMIGVGLSMLVLLPAAAGAAGKKAGASVSVAAEHSGYTDGLGTKSLVTASARLPLGRNNHLSVGLGTGERRVGAETLRARGYSAALVHRIAPGVTSRTLLAGGKAGPLFAGLAIGEELAFKAGGMELRGGARLSRYAGGRNVRSFHGGAEGRIGPVSLDYGLAAYGEAGPMPRGLVHRLNAGLEDRLGLTQVQLGQGSSLHEHDWRPDKVAGSFRSVGLKRKHKVARGVAVEVGPGWTAFERPKGRYEAVKWSAGLVLSR